jgi:hypothetical protein
MRSEFSKNVIIVNTLDVCIQIDFPEHLINLCRLARHEVINCTLSYSTLEIISIF